MDTLPTEEQSYQRIWICACAGANLVQSLCQTIEEANAFGRAALSGEVRIGAVGERRVVGVCAGSVKAIDRLEGRECEGRDCWKQETEEQSGEERVCG